MKDRPYARSDMEKWMCKNGQKKVETEAPSSLWRYGDGQNKAQVEAQTIKHENTQPQDSG